MTQWLPQWNKIFFLCEKFLFSKQIQKKIAYPQMIFKLPLRQIFVFEPINPQKIVYPQMNFCGIFAQDFCFETSKSTKNRLHTNEFLCFLCAKFLLSNQQIHKEFFTHKCIFCALFAANFWFRTNKSTKNRLPINAFFVLCARFLFSNQQIHKKSFTHKWNFCGFFARKFLVSKQQIHKKLFTHKQNYTIYSKFLKQKYYLWNKTTNENYVPSFLQICGFKSVQNVLPTYLIDLFSSQKLFVFKTVQKWCSHKWKLCVVFAENFVGSKVYKSTLPSNENYLIFCFNICFNIVQKSFTNKSKMFLLSLS